MAVLERARSQGLVGPGPVQAHLEHAKGFAEVARQRQHGAFVDLGSGGGLPGLVLAVAWPESRWVLVDSHRRSIDFLRCAIGELGLEDRVVVAHARAEEVGRDPEFRGQIQTVLARSFGPPAVTAECAAAFLVVGGWLVASEPPESRGDRWPTFGLALLGQRPLRAAVTASGHHFFVVEQMENASSRYPRRTGTPQRRPLF